MAGPSVQKLRCGARARPFNPPLDASLYRFCSLSIASSLSLLLMGQTEATCSPPPPPFQLVADRHPGDVHRMVILITAHPPLETGAPPPAPDADPTSPLPQVPLSPLCTDVGEGVPCAY